MIYINARFLTQPITGVQRFAIELCRSLKRSSYADRIQLVCPPNVLHTEIAKELQALPVGSRSGHLWEQLDLPVFLKSRGNPVLVNLANAAPLLYNRNIVTIHDLSVYQSSKWFSFTYRSFYKAVTPVIVSKALKVVTVSNSIKKELVDRLNLREDKVEVIYNGISELFLSGVPAENNKENYILTVSSIDPRKNILSLVRAFIKADVKDHDLYIIGGKAAVFSGSGLEREVMGRSDIKLLGRVSDEELLRLYSRAKLFVYLSLYEGFGIPNVEAMAMGVPVLTSNISSIKEVCSDAVSYVDPLDVDEASNEIKRLVGSTHAQKELSVLGLERSKLFRWEYAGEKMLKLLFHE
ncbi:group 1 glycosyl transferase [Flammeovirgaceae bacterium 311]|nr:group 1 glycosyl transferase [Flammeovirgaceae bacterium 311]